MISKKIPMASAAVVCVVIALSYAPALHLDFYGDDYSFLEMAGRSSLPQYLSFYFDPRLQTGWYRPLQGMYFGVEYLFFGGSPMGYHLFNVTVHLANCLLLWAIVWRVVNNWRVALTATLIYAGLPLYGVAVFWPADADFFVALFYLATLLSWVLYLQTSKARFYFATLACFWLALLTKEFGATLPVVLFLADRLLIRDKASPGALARRYTPFVATWAVYLPLEYYIQRQSVMTQMYHYGPGAHSIANLVGYLAVLAFPWGLPEPVSYAWLILATLLFLGAVVFKKSARLSFLGITAVLAFLPVVNFSWFFTRYLYLAVAGSAVLLAGLLEVVWKRVRLGPVLALAVAGIVLGNGLGVANATADFAEIARQTRVPFRDIRQHHPIFPEDTYLYFIDAPSPISEYSGMFFLRYGAGVHVGGNTFGGPGAHWSEHKNAYVIYFDEQRRTREIAADSSAVSVSLPTQVGPEIRLAGYDMPSTRAKRGDAFVIILNWQADGTVEKDYAISLRLVQAATGRVLAQSDGAPRNKPPTSAWKPGEVVVDARVLLVPQETPPGSGYRLQVYVYDPQTMRVLAVASAPDGGAVITQPVAVE